MKRLFAVAISVGVGFVFSRTNWVLDGDFPTSDEWEQLAILATALFATVLSWDGYLLSIEKKPLHSTWRFGIDVLLVFIYMLMIMTSAHSDFWLPILSVIFFLYICWDFLTMQEHFDQYYLKDGTPYSASPARVIRNYFGGIWGPKEFSRRPVITIAWFIYFLFLALIVHQNAPYNVYIACVFAIAGLVFYRMDKGRDGGFLMRRRLAMVILPLMLAASVPHLTTLLAGTFLP